MVRQWTPLTAKKRALFLEALAEYGNVTQAARTAGVGRSTLYGARKSDAVFAALWDEAAELGVDALEDEARRRAHDGFEEPLTCAKGLIYNDDGSVATVRKFSDTLLIFLLKGARPEKYRDNVHVTAPTSLGVTLVMERIQNDPSYAERAHQLARLISGTPGEGGGAD